MPQAQGRYSKHVNINSTRRYFPFPLSVDRLRFVPGNWAVTPLASITVGVDGGGAARVGGGAATVGGSAAGIGGSTVGGRHRFKMGFLCLE